MLTYEHPPGEPDPQRVAESTQWYLDDVFAQIPPSTPTSVELRRLDGKLESMTALGAAALSDDAERRRIGKYASYHVLVLSRQRTTEDGRQTVPYYTIGFFDPTAEEATLTVGRNTTTPWPWVQLTLDQFRPSGPLLLCVDDVHDRLTAAHYTHEDTLAGIGDLFLHGNHRAGKRWWRS